MIQTILVGIIFIAAVFYIGRMLYKQATTSGKDNERCDKCLPKEKATEKA